MTDEQAMHSDDLYRHRFQSLLSVDDMVEGVVDAVEAMDGAKNTFFIFTSDHGYRFGQFRCDKFIDARSLASIYLLRPGLHLPATHSTTHGPSLRLGPNVHTVIIGN